MAKITLTFEDKNDEIGGVGVRVDFEPPIPETGALTGAQEWALNILELLNYNGDVSRAVEAKKNAN